MSEKYGRLDALILDAARKGKPPLWDGACWAEAKAIAHHRDVTRVIDGRLQSLRKRGVIEYRKKSNGGPGWFECGVKA